MGKIIVIRHGETYYNVERRITGSIDIDLTEYGIKQAYIASEILMDCEIDYIYSSPLKRALQTANIISNKIDKPIEIMDEFSERNVGVFEGFTRDEIIIKYPKLWEQRITRKKEDAPPNGESINQLKERVFKGIRYICDNYTHDTVLIVAHAVVEKAIYSYFHKVTEDEFWAHQLENCHTSEFTY